MPVSGLRFRFVRHRTNETELISRYARLWAVVSIVLLLVLSLAFVVAGEWNRLTEKQSGILQAIGSSLLASVIAYILLALFLEPRKDEAQARRTTRFAVAEAHRQFRELFSVSLPSATYPSSRVPLPEFQAAFTRLVETSTRYDFKGASAEFTSFRLARLVDRNEPRRIELFRLCILDPRSTIIRAHAERVSKVRNICLEEAVGSLAMDIYVTLVALFDIRATLSTMVYLHNDLPFFRCEMFDNGMLLTYYDLVQPEFPAVQEYASTTWAYVAHKRCLEVSRRFASDVFRFGLDGPSDDLVRDEPALRAALKELDCPHDLAVLRERRDERFRRFAADLRRTGGISGRRP